MYLYIYNNIIIILQYKPVSTLSSSRVVRVPGSCSSSSSRYSSSRIIVIRSNIIIYNILVAYKVVPKYNNEMWRKKNPKSPSIVAGYRLKLRFPRIYNVDASLTCTT